MLAWINNNRGKSLCFLVIALAFGIPLVMRACGAFEQPIPIERPATCTRTLC